MLQEISISLNPDWRLFAGIVVAGIMLWWISKQIDVVRIQNYGKRRSWRFEEITYRSSRPDSSGDRSVRLYFVRYIDDRGELYSAICKTSMSTGVYFTEVERLGKYVAPIRSRQGPEIDCRRCGATVGENESVCPNCGTDRKPKI